MTVREILKLLRKDGWFVVRQTGSHRHASRHKTVAGKLTKTLHPKVLASILSQAQLEEP